MTNILTLDPTDVPVAVVVAIILASFVSEDLTCVAVGLLIAAGRVDWLPALAGCFVGIVLGDIGIWLIGRAGGRRILRWRWVRKLLPAARFAQLSRALCDRIGRSVVISRFVPGSRVPLFLAAGVLGTCPYRFLTWAFVAALLWTPLLVFSVAWTGLSLLDLGWVVVPVVGAGFVAVKLLPRLVTRRGRVKLHASLLKLARWEFWPAWVFYLPLVPWYAWLSLRYRSFTVWTAANPGIPAAGVVGESKADILSQLPIEWIVPTLLIPSGEPVECVRDAITERGWDYPLVLKPDAGQRGAGVKKVHDAVDLEKYLTASAGPVIAQPYHPGPFEAGVFYYRLPGEERGHVFSVTDKVFPVLTGDGRSTLEDLIWAHPRYRMQAATFLSRHVADADRVVAAGEGFPLALAGNHCQGTLFRDGGHLMTPELEAAFDAIAWRFDGFFVGRFDVRYADPDEFRRGRGFAIVELNGATSESTNLYDPTWSLGRAYRTLFRQWSLLFRIGQANRLRGHQPIGALELLALVLGYYREREVVLLSD